MSYREFGSQQIFIFHSASPVNEIKAADFGGKWDELTTVLLPTRVSNVAEVLLGLWKLCF